MDEWEEYHLSGLAQWVQLLRTWPHTPIAALDNE